MRIAVQLFLTAVFGWSILKSVEVLIREHSIDAMLFHSAGLDYAFSLLIGTLVLFLSISIVWFWFPFAKGHLIALSAIVIHLIETTVCCVIGAGNTDLAKQAYIASRESRNLPVRNEVLQMMEHPSAQYIPLGVSGCCAILWVVLIFVHKAGSERDSGQDFTDGDAPHDSNNVTLSDHEIDELFSRPPD